MDNFDIDIKEEIRARVDISQLVGRYVKLQNAGQNMKGLCPFHKEKSPSFNVNPAKGIFHCFGCGKGGDIFSFLMEIEGLSFPEAVKRLADDAGIKIEPQKRTEHHTPASTVPRNRALEINEMAMTFYYHAMKNEKIAIDYFKGRGLLGETVRDFRLGFSPPGWNGLTSYLQSLGVSRQELIECGLSIASPAQDTLYDRFRNRVMFPLLDIAGKPVGFAGRGMEPDAKPKYLNSPETLLYRKNRYLYGLDKARDHIKAKGYAVFVEGYMDYLSLYQNGIRNIIAASGTALTEGHGEMIKRFVNRVILLFDGDSAGIKAAERSLFILWAQNFDIRVCILPGEEDPDSLIHKIGPEAFIAILEKSQDGFLFAIETGKKLFGTASASSKSAIINYLAPLINNAPDPVVFSELIRAAAAELDLPQQTIISAVSSVRSEQSVATKTPVPKNLIEIIFTEEGSFLHLLVKHPQLIKKYKDRISVESFSQTYTKNIYSLLCREIEGSGDLENLLLHVSDEDVKSVLTLMMISDLPEGDADKDGDHKVKRFLLRDIKKKVHDITIQLRKETNSLTRVKLLERQLELKKSMETVG